MSQHQDLSLWNNAVMNLERDNLDQALVYLMDIKEQSCRIRFNIAIAYQRLGQLQEAIQVYTETTKKDEHFAIAYFQRGCVYFANSQYDLALKDFEESYNRLRGKNFIDYSQLGMRFKIYACDCLHNIAVGHVFVDDYQKAQDYLMEAQKVKVEMRHRAVDNSLNIINTSRNPVKRLTLIELPKEAVFCPPKSKVANMKKMDFLGKSKVVTAVDEDDKFIGFAGIKKQLDARQQAQPKSAPTSPPVPRREFERRQQNAQTDQSGARKLSVDSGRSNDAFVSDLNQALGNQTKTHLAPGKPVGKARTPPARWSPTRDMEETLPKPPRKPMPLPPGRLNLQSNSSNSLPDRLVSTQDDGNYMDIDPPQRKPMPLPPGRLNLQNNSSNSLTDKLIPKQDNQNNNPPKPKRQPPVPAIRIGKHAQDTPADTHDEAPPIIARRKSPAGSPPTEPKLQAEHTDQPSRSPTLPPRANRTDKEPEPSTRPKNRNRNQNPHTGKPRSDVPKLKKPQVPDRVSNVPTLPGERNHIILVEVDCNGTKSMTFNRGARLPKVLERVSKEFDLPQDTFNLWYEHEDDTHKVIANDEVMQSLWQQVSGGFLSLWAYGKR